MRVFLCLCAYVLSSLISRRSLAPDHIMSNLKRSWKSDLYLPGDAPVHSAKVVGRPKGSGQGPSRSTQQAGTTAAAAARQAAAGREAAETEAAAAAAEKDEAEDDVGDPTTWGFRCEKQHTAWRGCCAAHKSLYYDSLPRNLARSKEEAEGHQRRLQAEVEEWQPDACPRGCATASFTRQPAGGVTYYGRTCIFHISLYEYQCLCCNDRVAPSPLAFGCFPSTPTTPQIWFELQLLQLYSKQGHEGLSSTGWSGCLHPSLPPAFLSTF